MSRQWPKQPPPDFPLGKEEMTVEQLIVLLEQLPPGTKMQVKAGAYGDDAYVPMLRVWLYQGKLIEATIEPNHATGHHYNYPEGYSGVEEITDKIFGKKA